MALIIATELLVSLIYKLRMFFFQIDGSLDVFCDNHSVMENVTLPHLVMNKIHNSSHHFIQIPLFFSIVLLVLLVEHGGSYL